MDFMDAEFHGLDTNDDGVLDVRELKRSKLVQAHRLTGRR